MFGGKSYILKVKGSVSLALILIPLVVTLPVTEKTPPRISLIEGKKSNVAKGKWVEDRKRPLYSGFECKQWLSTKFSCRVIGRPDFSFEGYRWQPQGCNIPEFDRVNFLRRMQNKTIAFIGDSLGRQQFQSLMCMATGGKERPDVQNVGWEYGLVKPKGAPRPDGWAYRFPTTNTTILFYWSSTLTDLVPMNNTNPPHLVAMHLDRPPAFIKNYLHRFHVLILNTGHHWSRGEIEEHHWVMHVNGTRVQGGYLKEVGNAKDFTIHRLVKWLDAQIRLHPRLKAFFTTISPRHQKCNNTVPLSRGRKITGDGGSLDTIVESAVNGTKVKILDITALSELRDEAHIAGSKLKPKKVSNVTSTPTINDCLHWCLPGIPDTWNELLIAQL